MPVLWIAAAVLSAVAAGCSSGCASNDGAASVSNVIAQPTEPPAQDKEAEAMATDALITRVQRADWSVLDDQKAIPPHAAQPLFELLEHADGDVRELAVLCLGAVSGEIVRDGLFKALHDQRDTVRSTACRLLDAHAVEADVPRILKAMRGSPDEYVRECMALLAGRLGDQATIDPIKRQAAKEVNTEAKHAMDLAMARLGDAESRERWRQRLAHDDPARRAEAVRELLYIRDRSLATALVRLIEDRRDAMNVGPSHGPLYIRTCDVVLNVIDDLFEKPFTFSSQPLRRFSDAELAEARKVLATKR